MKNVCDKCWKPSRERLLTAFGALVCENCWDEYLLTPDGKVEYLIGIAREDYPASEFDSDFLGFAAFQWNKNKNQFDMSTDEINIIQNKLISLGLL